jgi:hypothetical protein
MGAGGAAWEPDADGGAVRAPPALLISTLWPSGRSVGVSTGSVLAAPIALCAAVEADAGLPASAMACHFSASHQQDHASGRRGTRFQGLCTRERRPASPRTGAGPDGCAGSTALCSAAWVPSACADGIMRSTRAHGAGIAGHSRGSAKSPELTPKKRGQIPLKFTHPSNWCARNRFLNTKSRTSGPYSH